ncbi:MAG: tRNA epoxyqueuosine(34) reductase QueG [Odoribacter sp.]
MHLKQRQLKELAKNIGFDAIGVVPVALLSDEVAALKRWVAAGKNADMEYMARNMEVRENPERLVEGARSMIVTLTNYYSSQRQPVDVPQLAMYAWGEDYHIIVKKRLSILLERLQQEDKAMRGRCFVDSAPVLEHSWAQRAGLGWQGKNTLLIHKGLGSYCFIGIIVSTAEFDCYDTPSTTSYCGNCTRCVEACPTGALTAGEVDARRCISYQTIENKGEYPEELKRLAGGRIFGCDACQCVCPWNLKLTEHQVPEFQPSPEKMQLTATDWRMMDESRFQMIFKNTALKRTGLSRIFTNL